MLPLATEPLSWTGYDYVDGILWGGHHWSVGTDRIIEYSFLDRGSGNYLWLDSEITAVEAALQTWSNVANIEFVRAADNDLNATLRFVSVKSDRIDALGLAFPPASEFISRAGLVFFAWDWSGWIYGLEPGGVGFTTILHEIGHALGLAHPHDHGGGSPIYPGVTSSDSLGDFELNQGVWTTMSYNDGLVSNSLNISSAYGFQATPMAFDVAAIQHLYGANLNFQSCSNVYELPSSNTLDSSYSSIWDTGGHDTISANGAIRDVSIDLRAAPLIGENAGGYISSVDSIYGGLIIANNVTIENAVGGIGNDVIRGNDTNNNLYGSIGDDLLSGGSGDDLLVGVEETSIRPGSGETDLLIGGNGNDRFILGNYNQIYYLDADSNDYAVIVDFNLIEDDRVALYGTETNYRFDNIAIDGRSGTGIFFNQGASSDLIGIIDGVQVNELNFATDFTWFTQDNSITPLNTPILRLQNSQIPGTYLFVGQEEGQSICGNFSYFIEEGIAFNVAIQPGDDLISLNRFHNSDLPGTYLYAGEAESQNIRANFSNFIEEGIAFYVYGVGAGIETPFFRFQNSLVPGTYLYATGTEADYIRANFPHFIEEGIAFEARI
ncbi:MAG: M10 family metallopeptidase [Xenococcus sp. (in: cyanobacteria)]